MTTSKELATLSLYVYNANQRNEPLLTEWQPVVDRTSGTHGFAYAVFRNTSTEEIVIAFRGSDDAADLSTNVGLIFAQERQAAAVYAQVLRDHGSDPQGSNISLTGHSLGGGLAATMAVWFNRPATVFDPAPTQGIATDVSVVNSVIGTLGPLAPQSIRDYAASLPSQFAAREAKVTSYYAPGSPVYAISTAANTITGPGQGNPVQFGIAEMNTVLGRINMHSQALLTAGVLAPIFAQSTIAVQRALPLVFDAGLYNLRADQAERNFLNDLIRSEQGTGDKLTHFAKDLGKLGTNIAGLNKAAQDALIAQGIEWYYWQGTDYAGKEFFTQTGALLQYTTARGDGLANAQNKADLYTKPWLQAITAQYGAGSASYLAYDQWNVASSSSGATATALNAGKSQIFLGQGGADTFTGGDLDDVMFAGAGADTLNGAGGDDKLYGGAGDDTFKGGAGSDKLYGGDGSDTYIVGEGKDTLVDTVDGQGKLQLEGGVDLFGGKGAGQRNTWIGQNTETYSFIQTQAAQIGTLTISNLSTGGQVKIEKFDLAQAQADGYLGIKLDNSPKLIVAVNSEPTIAIGTPFDAYDFDPNAFGNGSSTTVDEGSGRGFTVYLNQAAKAGETLILTLTGLAGKGLKAVLGNTTVDADGAVITLNEGQTQASFALIQDGATLEADTPGSISLSYQGTEQSATSNAWGVNLKDTGEPVRTYVFLRNLSITASVQMRTGELGKSGFKSNTQQQRSCRTRRASARGHVPGHASPLPRATRNEALP